MAWVALCTDRNDVDTGALRRAAREAHFGYIESIMDRLLVAGPLAAPGSTEHRASLFVYRVNSEAEARALLESDPFWQAGIYGDCRFWPFTPAAGEWLGGAIWKRPG
jgi:uncharacterized protein YciI